MTDHPIIFTGENVRGIYRDQKTMTRRVCHGQRAASSARDFPLDRCPYGTPGDRLWVRETWRAVELPNGCDGIVYRADDVFVGIENTPAASDLWFEAFRAHGHWRPSIHMPKWVCRLWLEVVSVRVERLQEITEEDAIAEGVEDRPAFSALWDSINAARGYPWASDPLVRVIEFRREASDVDT